jgi:hypothetical protein
MAGRRGVAIACATLGVLIAAVAMTRVGWTLTTAAPHQPLWPLPALYLIEVVALSGVVLAVVVTNRARFLPAAWAAIGGLSTLTVLGAMTIGPLVGGSILLLIPAVLIADRTQSVVRDLTAFFVGLASQAAVMLAAIRVMLR